MNAANEHGVKIVTGVKVKSVDVAKTKLELENGSTVSADLIIAADGVHVRRQASVDACSSLRRLVSYPFPYR